MENNKVLILANNVGRYISNSDTKITELYNKAVSTKFERVLRKVSLKYNMPGWKKWFGKWIYRLDTIDTLVLFDTGNAAYICELIKKEYPKLRIILWYWNAVSKSIPVESINREHCEIWSYRLEDCQKYNLKYNTQFYIESISTDCNSNRVEQDIYFAGADKNRSDILYELAKKFDDCKLSYKYILTKAKNSEEKNIPYSNPISQSENRNNMSTSKAILDIVEEKQFSGFTLRPFEAIALKKKLLTNDPNIKKLKFYSKNNIFIINEDSFGELREFINSDFDDSCNEALKYYEFNNWVERFRE